MKRFIMVSLVFTMLMIFVIFTSYKYYVNLNSPSLYSYLHLTNADRKKFKLKETKLLNNEIKSTNIRIPYIKLITTEGLNNSFLKSTLKSGGKIMTIYVHHKKDYISNKLIKYATWEQHLLNQFEAYIKDHVGIQVLDAGCNVGVYTLTAAALGCKVVSVDANYKNTERLSQSLYVNNLGSNVTVCLNALNSQRRDFVLSMDVNNVGGQYIIESNDDKRAVKGIIIDDLIELFDNDKPILIKIDIQGREIEALINATRLFEERYVKLVLIEWKLIKLMPGIEGLITFFIKRGFKPYKEFKKINELNISNYKSWPYDIVWIKL